MHLINFKAQFADDISKGIKQMTIRLPRKRDIYVGDKLKLYTGLRTKKAKLIAEVKCSKIENIYIGGTYIEVRNGNETTGYYEIGSREADTFAQRDGFKTSTALKRFFEDIHEIPFKGIIIHW